MFSSVKQLKQITFQVCYISKRTQNTLYADTMQPFHILTVFLMLDKTPQWDLEVQVEQQFFMLTKAQATDSNNLVPIFVVHLVIYYNVNKIRFEYEYNLLEIYHVNPQLVMAKGFTNKGLINIFIYYRAGTGLIPTTHQFPHMSQSVKGYQSYQLQCS